MERVETVPSDIDSDRESLVKHNLGWSNGRSLCGAEIPPREIRPGWPDCVVCLDLLNGLSKEEYQVLWGLNQ